LPSDLFELYSAAVKLSVHDDVAEAALRTVAGANQLEGRRREFTSDDVHAALTGEELARWNALLAGHDEQQPQLPLVKVLENDKALAGHATGLFQFKHLTFQEALAAQAVCDGDARLPWDGAEMTAEALEDPFRQNVLRIGGGRLGTVLSRHCSEWQLNQKLRGLKEEGWGAFLPLLHGNETLISLELGDNALGDHVVAALAKAFIDGGVLAQLALLSLSSNQIGDAGAASLAAAFRSGSLAHLKTLLLNDNQIGNAGAASLAEAFAKGGLGKLGTLVLGSNEIGDGGVSSLAMAFTGGALAQLQRIYLGHNRFGKDGASALADALARGALAQLKHLYLYYNAIGEAAKQLRAACRPRGIVGMGF
jgi:hypothetical protein